MSKGLNAAEKRVEILDEPEEMIKKIDKEWRKVKIIIKLQKA